MGRIVIVAYRPKVGHQQALRQLALGHMRRLRAEGLVSEREAVLMEAKDGTVIEVFEWKSEEAIEAAHGNPAVQAMWKEYGEVCDYIPAGKVPEMTQLFSEFTPLHPTSTD